MTTVWKILNKLFNIIGFQLELYEYDLAYIKINTYIIFINIIAYDFRPSRIMEWEGHGYSHLSMLPPFHKIVLLHQLRRNQKSFCNLSEKTFLQYGSETYSSRSKVKLLIRHFVVKCPTQSMHKLWLTSDGLIIITPNWLTKSSNNKSAPQTDFTYINEIQAVVLNF